MENGEGESAWATLNDIYSNMIADKRFCSLQLFEWQDSVLNHPGTKIRGRASQYQILPPDVAFMVYAEKDCGIGDVG